MYTYSKDAETGLCNRHQQVEIINMIVVDQMNHQKSLSGGDSEVQRLPEDGTGNRGGGEAIPSRPSTSKLMLPYFQVESTFPEEQFSPPPTSRAPWFGPSGSLPHLNRPCLVHNGGLVPACPTHGPRGPHAGVGPPPPPANGCLPGQNSKYSGFSPERVI